MRRPLFERSTAEILVILVGLTVCGYVVVTGAVIMALAFFTDRDLSRAASSIGDIINTLIGLLAGFLAGRTNLNGKSKEPLAPEEPPHD
jgi:hypothetical protein